MEKFIIIGLVAVAVFGICDLLHRNKKKGVMLNKLNSQPDFTPERTITKISLFLAKMTGISFDIKREKAVLISGEDLKIISFNDILECAVIKDGETVTKTSRSSQIAGAAVGGVLFGGVGALAGALSGTTQSQEVINGVSVKILLNSLDYPWHVVDFIEMTSTGSTTPAIALQEATQLHDFIKIIIHQKELEKKS